MIENMFKKWFENSLIKEIWDDEVFFYFENQEYLIGMNHLFLFLAICFAAMFAVLFIAICVIVLCVFFPILAILVLTFLFTWIGISVYMIYKNKDN